MLCQHAAQVVCAMRQRVRVSAASSWEKIYLWVTESLYLQGIYPEAKFGWNWGMNKYERRRLKLLQLRDRDFGRSNSALARKIGKDASYVARMLYPLGKDGRKRIGEDFVEIIENAFQWPSGWLDSDALLPARGIHEIRRANLQRWTRDHAVPPKERSYFSQLLGGGSFGERAARRLEGDYGMGENYLDRPIAEPEVGIAAAHGAAQPGAGEPPDLEGAFFAAARNGRGGTEWLEWITLPNDLRSILLAYNEGGPAKQEALRQLAELPEPEIATLLLVIQAIKARYPN